MIETTARSRPLYNVELVLLCLFAVALPLKEAPKNVFWGLFLLVWLGRSLASRNFGSLPKRWDLIFLALLVAPVLSIAHAPYASEWKEMGDIFGYVSLGWMISRSKLERKQVMWLLAALVGATLVGLGQGYSAMLASPSPIWLQLHSVGHVNHSALYGAAIASLAAAAALSLLAGNRRWAGLGATLVALVLLAAMIMFASRGAFLCYLAALLLCILGLYGGQFKRLLGILAAVAILGGGVGWVLTTASPVRSMDTLIGKVQRGLAAGQLSSYRLQGAHTSFEIWRQHPWTGVGAGAFSSVSRAKVEAWVKERGETFDPNAYLFSNHAHGLYPNTLAERGLIGFTVLLALMVAWAVALVRHRPGMEASITEKMRWSAGMAGWALVFIGGLFNTTLHHEHGMLAMVYLGLLLGARPASV